MSQSSTEIVQPSPGPWTVDAQSSLPRVIGPDRVIAAVVSGNGPGSSREVALKDAQLLAAALDMYGALIGFFEADFTNDLKPYFDKARSALAKAEGRAES